jgi:hypothetical protein
MKRGSFLYKSLLFIMVPLLVPFSTGAAGDKDDPVLVFFSDIRQYITTELGIELGESFYTHRSEGYQHYLYVSKPDEIRLPDGEANFRYYGSDLKRAQTMQIELIDKGYHTLLYRTAATSAARVQSPLYQYPLHCLSFIALHESHHIHRRNGKNPPIPYSLEEAAGDVLGNYVSLDFARRFPEKVDTNLVKEQILLNETLYLEINRTRARLDGGKNDRREFNRLTRYLNKKLKHSDSFKRDRFLYPVNNAYFIRYGYYTANYFLLRDLYFKTGSAKNFLGYLDQLPEDESAAIEQIKRFVVS